MNSTLAATKMNFVTNKLAAIITIGVLLIQIIANSIVAAATGLTSTQLSYGNHFFLYLLMIPFFIVLSNYKKFMHLNADKSAFYKDSVLTYAITAIIISLCNALFYTFIDPLFSLIMKSSNLMEFTGWMSNGIFIAFLQQIIFLFLVCIALHVLISLQFYWAGWVADGIIIIILGIFIPIAPLRHLLVSFFALVMFNTNYLVHIFTCLVLSGILYVLGVIPLRKRTT